MLDPSLPSEQPGMTENLFIAGEKTSKSNKKLWPYLTLMFLILFITDIAVRKFIRITNRSV